MVEHSESERLSGEPRLLNPTRLSALLFLIAGTLAGAGVGVVAGALAPALLGGAWMGAAYAVARGLESEGEPAVPGGDSPGWRRHALVALACSILVFVAVCAAYVQVRYAVGIAQGEAPRRVLEHLAEVGLEKVRRQLPLAVGLAIPSGVVAFLRLRGVRLRAQVGASFGLSLVLLLAAALAPLEDLAYGRGDDGYGGLLRSLAPLVMVVHGLGAALALPILYAGTDALAERMVRGR